MIRPEGDDGEIHTCPLSVKQIESERLRAQILAEMSPEESEQLKQFGYRLKFPAKSGDLSRRWCSGKLKAEVQSGVMADLEQTQSGVRILIVSGERRGESVSRAKYNEMELHRCNATSRKKRLVHTWRPVIDHSEKDVWEIIRRHRTVRNH